MPTGMMKTYDLTVGVIVDMEDMIHMLDPDDVPMLSGAGADGASLLTFGSCFEKKVEWLDESLLLPKSTAGAAGVAGDATIQVATGHQLRFAVGDVLLLATGERVRVTGYGAGDLVNITRAFNSTTAQNIALGSSIVNYGQALPEGSDPGPARALDRSARLNWTQIFGPTAVHVTESENVVRKYGLGGTTEFDKQVSNRTKEMNIEREQAILYGKALEDTGNAWRTMGGFIDFITTNVNSASTALTETLLLDQIQSAYDAGGNPKIVLVGSRQKRVISQWGTALTLNANRLDNGRGFVVDAYDNDFGRVTVKLNRNVRSNDLFGYDREQAEYLSLRPFQFQMLAKTGDAMKGMLVSENTMRFRRQGHAFRFSALT